MRAAVIVVGLVLALSVAAIPPVAGVPAGSSASVQTIAVPANDSAAGSTVPRIVAVYPNPIAAEDRGEHVVVEFLEPTNTTGWTIVDDAGHAAGLPEGTISGRVRLSPEPRATEGDRSGPTERIDGRLALANGGDEIALRRPNGTIVDSIDYRRAPEGELYRRDGDRWRWRPLGATSIDPVTTTPETATAFVLPDAPDVVEDELRDADRRILLAGYTLTSERVVDALLDAHRRDVEVRVLLEGSPVGGVSQRQATALDRLVAAGVPIMVFAGERDPFGVHHAKYAVVDDRALVLTENFKPAGTGGRSSRGWGVSVEDAATATGLAEVFRADRSGPGTVSWDEHRSTVDPVPGGSSSGSYPTHFSPAEVPVERVELLVAPDNARPELVELLRSADDSIRIQQMTMDGIDDPLLRASIAAARNGTEVQILLSSASFAERENRALAREIDRLAEREDLPISAKLVDPRGRFGKVHAKVAIVDDRHVILGSLNWNRAAYGENREVVLVLTGEEVAGYYAEVFEADARDQPLWRVPSVLVAVVCAVWLVLGAVALARIRWATR